MESTPWFAKHGPGWCKIPHTIFHKHPQEICRVVYMIPEVIFCSLDSRCVNQTHPNTISWSVSTYSMNFVHCFQFGTWDGAPPDSGPWRSLARRKQRCWTGKPLASFRWGAFLQPHEVFSKLDPMVPTSHMLLFNFTNGCFTRQLASFGFLATWYKYIIIYNLFACFHWKQTNKT